LRQGSPARQKISNILVVLDRRLSTACRIYYIGEDNSTFKVPRVGETTRPVNIDGRQLWQIDGGKKINSYVRFFLEWDVIAIGPGRRGKWPACGRKVILADGYSAQTINCLERFYNEVKPGHLVVLKTGTDTAYGVGEIVEENVLWLDDFGDVDGRDLEHVRRVRWLWKYDSVPMVFPELSLHWGSFQHLNSPGVEHWLRTLPEPTVSEQLVKLPPSCIDGRQYRPSDFVQVADFLFDEGISAKSIDELAAKFAELQRIANWYYRSKKLSPSKYETLAYLVVPLLRALGWTPQRMAMEWESLDIALFTRTPRSNKNFTVAVEVMKIGESCLNAYTILGLYALQSGREHCRQLIVTDGLRYVVFRRDESVSTFNPDPIAYLNLARGRDVYSILGCMGTGAALLTMAADWNGDTHSVRA
jgi:hypothetical protein